MHILYAEVRKSSAVCHCGYFNALNASVICTGCRRRAYNSNLCCFNACRYSSVNSAVFKNVVLGVLSGNLVYRIAYLFICTGVYINKRPLCRSLDVLYCCCNRQLYRICSVINLIGCRNGKVVCTKHLWINRQISTLENYFVYIGCKSVRCNVVCADLFAGRIIGLKSESSAKVRCTHTVRINNVCTCKLLAIGYFLIYSGNLNGFSAYTEQIACINRCCAALYAFCRYGNASRFMNGNCSVCRNRGDCIVA